MNLDTTDSRKIRKFGLVALIFFGFLCALGFWLKKPLPACLFGVLSILGLGFILIPARLRPLYTAWVNISQFLAKIVTFLILVVNYYLVITPAALIKCIFGGRPLPIKPNKKSSSYWVTRNEPVQPKERFLKRY